MTTWDRQDKPLAKEFQRISQVVGRLDFTGIEPALAEIGIVIPDEWSKPHGHSSHFGLTGPAVTPYVSVADGDAVPGRPLPDVGSANEWLMSSALTTNPGAPRWTESRLPARVHGLGKVSHALHAFPYHEHRRSLLGSRAF